jgi:hypothetical protein
MSAGSKRPVPETDHPSSPESKKACIEHDTISSLLAQIQAEFRRREDEKENAFIKWEQEGIHILFWS